MLTENIFIVRFCDILNIVYYKYLATLKRWMTMSKKINGLEIEIVSFNYIDFRMI